MPESNRYFYEKGKYNKKNNVFKRSSLKFSIILVAYFIVTPFVISTSTLFQFLYQPYAQNIEQIDNNNPVYYLFTVWVICNSVALLYVIYNYFKAFLLVSGFQNRRRRLGEYLFEIESILQEVVEQESNELSSLSIDKKYDYYQDSDNPEKKSVRKRKPMLWELYDSNLDELNKGTS